MVNAMSRSARGSQMDLALSILKRKRRAIGPKELSSLSGGVISYTYAQKLLPILVERGLAKRERYGKYSHPSAAGRALDGGIELYDFNTFPPEPRRRFVSLSAYPPGIDDYRLAALPIPPGDRHIRNTFGTSGTLVVALLPDYPQLYRAASTPFVNGIYVLRIGDSATTFRHLEMDPDGIYMESDSIERRRVADQEAQDIRLIGRVVHSAQLSEAT